jgi:MoaA/NifB/PqqE/SkfB family radical SAM enzyme
MAPALSLKCETALAMIAADAQPSLAPRGAALKQDIELPQMVCFRVTRFCNAHCGFCLAPPDGGRHPSASTLKNRIDWLLARGVESIHFCGGEPTIHRQLPELIAHVYSRGGKSRLTTNGIALSDDLICALRSAATQVKVSLHGDEPHHDEIVGRSAFCSTTDSIRRLLSAGVITSVQTTIVSSHLEVVPWIIGFCLRNRVRRVSFLPFIMRGSGYLRRSEYGLTRAERRILHYSVKDERRKHTGRLDIRLLDFNVRPIHVVEPDGRLILEGASEALDVLLTQIPA